MSALGLSPGNVFAGSPFSVAGGAFGFEVVGAWTVDEERFIWVLHYDGPKSWEEVDAEYYNSEERKAIDPDPARHIEKSEHFLMREVR